MMFIKICVRSSFNRKNASELNNRLGYLKKNNITYLYFIKVVAYFNSV